MTLNTRRIIYISFILAFLIITSSLILYATGYRIKLTWPINFNQTFQKTGMFIFATKPSGAKIYLNQKPAELFFKKIFSREDRFIKTPAKIKNLLPGEYNATLELDGYWPWQKKLTIKPGESTYAENINLFKQDLPRQVLNTQAKNILLSTSKKYLYIYDKNKIVVAGIDNEIIIDPSLDLLTANSEIRQVSWSYKSNKLLIDLDSVGDTKFIYDIDDNQKMLNLNALIGKNIYNLKWDKDDQDKIYYQQAGTINSYQLSKKSKKILASGENYLDYIVKDGIIFIISKIQNKTIFKSLYLKSGSIINEIELPASPEYKFINAAHNFINLYDTKYKTLYLIDPTSIFNPLKEIITNVVEAKWINSSKLLYYSDFEIWLLEINDSFPQILTSQKTLLTRVSQPINSALWHPSNNYIIFATDTSLNIMELDEREKRNITELIKLDKISSISLNSKGDILYFYAKIDNQEGLYKLAIQ